MEYDTIGGDLPPSQQPNYFYRLRNSNEQHYFKQSEEGSQCPICGKVERNIRMHFNKSRNCTAKMNMDHFMFMYEIMNGEARRRHLEKENEIVKIRKLEENEAKKKSQIPERNKEEQENSGRDDKKKEDISSQLNQLDGIDDNK